MKRKKNVSDKGKEEEVEERRGSEPEPHDSLGTFCFIQIINPTLRKKKINKI